MDNEERGGEERMGEENGQGTCGEDRNSERYRFVISKRCVHSTKTVNEKNIFLFFSDSWSINGCCNNTRNYWSFRTFLLV